MKKTVKITLFMLFIVFNINAQNSEKIYETPYFMFQCSDCIETDDRFGGDTSNEDRYIYRLDDKNAILAFFVLKNRLPEEVLETANAKLYYLQIIKEKWNISGELGIKFYVPCIVSEESDKRKRYDLIAGGCHTVIRIISPTVKISEIEEYIQENLVFK